MWIGVMENRKDPLKVGRVQVRIAGHHTEAKEVLPTEQLPWSYCVSGVEIREGDYVCGEYLDGEERQVPIVLGVIPGIPDTVMNRSVGFTDPRTDAELKTAPRIPQSLSINAGGNGVHITEQGSAPRNPAFLNEPTVSRIARNEGITQTPIQVRKDQAFKSIPLPMMRTVDEPETPYASVYPYNHVWETESGHVIELDDTPGAERIHIYHRSGTSQETFPDGTHVAHVNNDAFEIVLSDKTIYVNGDCNITSKKNLNLKAGGDLNIEIGGSINMKSDQMMLFQALQGISSFTTGPHLVQGLPLSLNGGGSPPLGPAGPIVISQSALTVVAPPVPPNPADPGNQALAQRPGANLGTKMPNELSPPSESPQGIPVPMEANTAPVPTITSTEGADVMIRALNRAKISDPIQRAMIYAQAAHESNNFKVLFESFKYTDQGLMKTWPSRFTANNVSQYVRQPEKIANYVYANRMGNGDEASGDGWKYRGRGFIQITGKENYVQASTSLQQDFINYPDAAAQPETAADLAVWYFQKGKKTGYRGNYADIVSATKFVNGGTIGLDDRTKRFELAKANNLVTTLNTQLV